RHSPLRRVAGVFLIGSVAFVSFLPPKASCTRDVQAAHNIIGWSAEGRSVWTGERVVGGSGVRWVNETAHHVSVNSSPAPALGVLQFNSGIQQPFVKHPGAENGAPKLAWPVAEGETVFGEETNGVIVARAATKGRRTL